MHPPDLNFEITKMYDTQIKLFQYFVDIL
jgi:predicted RNA-binding protein associated with RNAse of E/G family